GSQILVQTSGEGSLCYSLPWGGRDCRDVQLLPSSYLLRLGFLRPNCARKQNSRQATDRVFDVGSTECPGSEHLNTTIHSMRNYGNSFWSVVIQCLIRRTASPNQAMERTGSARHGSCSPADPPRSYRAALRL